MLICLDLTKKYLEKLRDTLAKQKVPFVLTYCTVFDVMHSKTGFSDRWNYCREFLDSFYFLCPSIV